MIGNAKHLKIDLSQRDCKFALTVGLVALMTGLGLITRNWPLATFAPLAIMLGLFLVCLVALMAFKKAS